MNVQISTILGIVLLEIHFSEKRKFSFIPSLLTVLHEQLLNCIKCFFYSERVSYCQNNAAKQNSVT